MEVSEIIERVDILSYISQFCELEERNDGEYWGLSPLKEENTPSFSVNVDKQRFYDFSSGKGGNVLDFIRQYHKCDFMEGLRILKKYANIRDDDPSTSSQRLLATSVAKKFKNHQKKEKENKSTILPADYMNRYERNPNKLSVWRDEGITPESMERFSVRYDPFSDRIVYPIKNSDGKIVNIGGRTLDPEWKEKNLRKYTYFFGWNGGVPIYGLPDNINDIKHANQIILFEGAKSVLLADTYGVKNTGALLTSHLSKDQLKMLIKIGVNEVVFALDKDVDIRTIDRIRALMAYTNISYIYDKNDLLEEKDAPVDRGKDVFLKLLAERRRLT